MAFVDILKQDPISWVVLVDVSFDDFSSVAYRWSTLSCSIGGNDYEGRIPKGGVGKLSRAFGNENTPTSSTVTVSLDNTDFGADWLLDRTTVASQVMRARFKLTLAIYLPGNLSSVQTKVLGTFSMLNFPMRDRERVTLQLADDGLGRFNEPLVSPTLREWRDDAGSTVDNCPIVEEYGPEPACDWDVPLPLAFGQGRLTCFPASNLNAIDGLGEVIDGLMAYSRAIPVCVTTSSAAVVPADARGHVGDVRALWGTFGQDVLMGNKKYDGAGTTISIPPTFRTPADTPVDVGVMANVDLVIWEVMKSQAISKDGTSWYILWVKFNIAAYITWFKITRRTQVGGEQVDGGTSPIAFLVPYTPVGGAGGLNPTPPPAWAALETLSVGDKRKYNGGIYEVITAGTTGSVGPGFSTSQDITDGTVHWRYATSAVLGVSIPYGQIFAAFSHFEVLGHPFSARTVTDQDDQLGVNVIKDLVSYYSHGSAADLDTTRFATALSMSPMSVAGVIQPQRPLSTRFKYSASRPPADAISRGQLWQALSDICQSADLDISLTWEGKLAVYGSYFSYADLTSTRVQIDETRGNNVVERIPSKGERWAPYNRVYMVSPDGEAHGPFDNPDPNVDWGRPLDRVFQGKWSFPFTPASSLYGSNVWFSNRRLESVIRPVIRFVTDREGLQLDLADLFDLSWTRGGSAGPYQNPTTFRVDKFALDFGDLSCGIEAVWVDDVNTIRPFLLDDEDLLLRKAAAGGRTATVQNSDATVTFSSGSLITDGVQPGDILVLQDATQAANVFTRFRQIRIDSVTDATHLELATADLAFDAGSPVAVASWKILRGYLTYPDSSSDPTNYPNDGDMYGKASDEDDEYSDASAANVLL